MQSFGKYFLIVNTWKLNSRGSEGCISCWITCYSKSHSGVLAFKAWGNHGEQLRHVTMWQGWSLKKRVQERLLVKSTAQLQQEIPEYLRHQYHGGASKDNSCQWNRAGLSCGNPFGGTQKFDTEISTVGLMLCFVQTVTVPWSFPLEVRKYIIAFTKWHLEVLKTFWRFRNWIFERLCPLKETGYFKDSEFLKCLTL